MCPRTQPGTGTPRISWGISTEMEAERCNQYRQTYPGDFNTGNEVYGNLIAGVLNGIRIAALCGDSIDNKLYNNTIVASERGFHVGTPQPGDGWSGNDIRNNLLVVFAAADRHSNTYARAGVTWSHNLFFGGDADAIGVTDAATHAVFADPLLAKTTGWKEIAVEELDAAWWVNTAESPAINRGADLGSAYATDFAGVFRPQAAGWDIGAFEQ